MLPEQQQRIMGYFIEEAKDHLNTIEQGLLKLQATIEDPEMANEIFRAAHSIKGGAAMLGLESIQYMAHRMEDYFKILKDSPVHANRSLESLFLQVFDHLKELVEQLQGPFGLTQDKSEEIMSGVEPLFDQLALHLSQLVQSGISAQPLSATVGTTNELAVRAGAIAPASDRLLHSAFLGAVTAHLRQMLALFKQADTPQSRQAIQHICQQLSQLGEQFGLTAWCELMQTAWLTLSEENSYRILAPVLIKEIKKAQEWVLSGRAAEIAVSDSMQALLPKESEELSSEFEPPVNATVPDLEPTPMPDAGEKLSEIAAEAAVEPEAVVEPEAAKPEPEIDESANPDGFNNFEEPEAEILASSTEDITSPEVSAAEYNRLSDLFDEDNGDLDMASQTEVLPQATPQSEPRPELDVSAVITELEDKSPEASSPTADVIDELSDLFDDVLLAESAQNNPPLTGEEAPLSSESAINSSREEETGEALSSHSAAVEASKLLDPEHGKSSATVVSTAEPTEDMAVDEFFEEFDVDSGSPQAADREQTAALFELDADNSSLDDGSLEETAGFNDFFSEDENSAAIAVSLNLNGTEFDQVKPDSEDPLAPAMPAAETMSALLAATDAPIADLWDSPKNAEPDNAESQNLDNASEALEASADEELFGDATASDEMDLNSLWEEETDALEISLEADAETDTTPLLALTPTATRLTDETVDSTDFDFGNLERLLEAGNTSLVPSAPVLVSHRPATALAPYSTGLSDQTLRVMAKDLDSLSNLVGELVVNRNTLEQDQGRMRQFLDNLLSQIQQLNDVGQRIHDLYERSLLESSLMANRQAHQLASSREMPTTSHATGVTFDALEMDRFTDFHSLSQEMIELIVRVQESASDIGYTVESSDQVTRQFRQATMQLQEGLNKARMVPFSQTADRLPRAVRDISIKCGKEARLVVEGRDTLIDKVILEQLYDPMTHLVNNAIAHGVELPDRRQAAGKSREGAITVCAFYQGNQTVICVADDGGGIDPELVKRKAVQKGLISPAEANALSVLDVYELLFYPGFSTRDQVDDYAGRGVGLDVVRTSLSEVRGTITIDSELGKGTSFTIRLPLTLSISKALSCVSNQAMIAFPMDGVEDMFDLPRDQVRHNDQGQPCAHWRDSLLPYQSLTELLKLNRTLGRGRVYGGNRDQDTVSVVVLRSATSLIAFQVDQMLGEQEIVIKPLEAPVPKPVGIAGATVLGDGRIMPVADVLELIDIATGRMRRETASMDPQGDQAGAEAAVQAKIEPTVLIVDDSITVRELLSISFLKVGYRVEQARDGQEAWEKLCSGLPCDLVFCDIEMPQMDGLELLSRMQNDGGLKRIPIAMLTSRGADRHRQIAVDLGASGYFTKPYLEEALLDAAQRMLNGESLVKTDKGEE